MKDANNIFSFRDRSYYEKSYDLFGEMLLEKIADDFEAEIEEEQRIGNTQELDAFFTHYDSKNLKAIETYFRKQKRKNFFTRTLPRIGQVAAVFIATIALAGSVAVATSHMVRIRVMELLFSIEEEYTSLSLQENVDASFDVPSDWDGNYYPSVLPENVEVYGIDSTFDSKTVIFISSDTLEKEFLFIEGGQSQTYLDTEGATIKPVKIHGHEGILASTESVTSVAWSNSIDYFVVLLYDDDPDLALLIAESVMRIN